MAGCAVVCVFLDLPLDECVSRVMARRGHPTLAPSKAAGGVVRDRARLGHRRRVERGALIVHL